MSVLIKGANIPVMGCLFCQLRNGDNCVASDILDVSEQVYKSTRERHPNCPLVEAPTPHGRLIDADYLRQKLEKHRDMCGDIELSHGIDVAISILNNAPTIIEAEVSENGKM